MVPYSRMALIFSKAQPTPQADPPGLPLASLLPLQDMLSHDQGDYLDWSVFQVPTFSQHLVNFLACLFAFLLFLLSQKGDAHSPKLQKAAFDVMFD